MRSSTSIAIDDNEIFNIIENQGVEKLVKINEGYSSNDVLSYLINKKINIVSYNELLPSLNEIFIQLVEDTHANARAFQNI